MDPKVFVEDDQYKPLHIWDVVYMSTSDEEDNDSSTSEESEAEEGEQELEELEEFSDMKRINKEGDIVGQSEIKGFAKQNNVPDIAKKIVHKKREKTYQYYTYENQGQKGKDGATEETKRAIAFKR
jgi:predicted DNA-binding WGR domain protein